MFYIPTLSRLRFLRIASWSCSGSPSHSTSMTLTRGSGDIGGQTEKLDAKLILMKLDRMTRLRARVQLGRQNFVGQAADRTFPRPEVDMNIELVTGSGEIRKFRLR